MRAAMNAILYLLRTGCPWLPRDSFPPRSTVYNMFRKFQRYGVWEAIWAVAAVFLPSGCWRLLLWRCRRCVSLACCASD
jgi:transposase